MKICSCGSMVNQEIKCCPDCGSYLREMTEEEINKVFAQPKSQTEPLKGKYEKRIQEIFDSMDYMQPLGDKIKAINEIVSISLAEGIRQGYEKGLTAGGKIGRIDGEEKGKAEYQQ